MKFNKTPFAIFIALMSAAMLAACGGSGGGSGPVAQHGISGTGYYAHGAVQRFGSIYVNGQKFETKNATFVIDGNKKPNGQKRLIVGNIVEIQATQKDNGTLVAEKVIFDAELEGPVAAESIKKTSHTFKVAGQTVQATGTTVFEGTKNRPAFDFTTLRAGDIVEISGTIDANGTLRASSVELQSPKKADGMVEVKGTIKNHNPTAHTFRINELTVNYGSLQVEVNDGQFKPVEKGLFVEVSGTLNADGILQATELELEDREPNVEQGDTAEIEGIVKSAGESTFTLLNGLKVAYDQGTSFDDGGSAELIQAGSSVEIKGQINASGVLQATQIEVEDAENDPAIEISAKIGQVQGENITLLGDLKVKATGDTRLNADRDDVRKGFNVSNLQTGDYVYIAAVKNADGALVATLIERDDVETNNAGDVEVELQGPMGDRNTATPASIPILGVQVQFNSATQFKDANDNAISESEFFSQVHNGDIVEISGIWNGNFIKTTEVSLESDGTTPGGPASQPKD